MIKERIKELREKNNLTISAFARSLGISPTSVSLYESGKQNPGKKTIQRICEVYGVDENYLTSDDKGKKTAETALKKAAPERPALKEIKKAAPEGSALKEIKKAAEKLAAPDDVIEGVEAIATVAEMLAAEEKKPEKKAKKIKEKKKKKDKKKKSGNKAVIIFQSPEGKDITPKQIRKLVPEGTDYVCVRMDENKLYWVKGSESGVSDIW